MIKSLREQYINNEIFRIGDIVSDSNNVEQFKILDRGSNYVTVESSGGIMKKWLNEIVGVEKTESEPEFSMTESGQFKMFGFESKNFDEFITQELLDQFEEFNDLYSKHQIVKLLDSALCESDLDKKYQLFEKISSFYSKQKVEEPLLVEGFKTEIERLRLAQIVAVVAGTPVIDQSPYKTIKAAVVELRKKYVERKQWQVLWPFFVLVNNSGISGIINTLPYKFDVDSIKNNDPSHKPYDAKLTEEILELLENNLDELVGSLVVEDIEQTFSADEYSEEPLSEDQIDEALRFVSRLKKNRTIRPSEVSANNKNLRALTHAESNVMLMTRARRLADTMLKRRIYRKDLDKMTPDEVKQFESQVPRRKLLVARLAQRLVGKIKLMQTLKNNTAHLGS